MSDLEDLVDEFGGHVAPGSDAIPKRMRKRYNKGYKRRDHYVPVDQRPISDNPEAENRARVKTDDKFRALMRAERPDLEGKKPTIESGTPRTIQPHVYLYSKGIV